MTSLTIYIVSLLKHIALHRHECNILTPYLLVLIWQIIATCFLGNQFCSICFDHLVLQLMRRHAEIYTTVVVFNYSHMGYN